MKVTELRIGNYFTDGEDVKTVTWFTIKELSTHSKESAMFFKGWCQPIPLTEQWLLDFGFFSNPYKDRYEMVSHDLFIECDKTKGILDLYIETPYVVLKTVHQLQNLFFALTGKELTLKK